MRKFEVATFRKIKVSLIDEPSADLRFYRDEGFSDALRYNLELKGLQIPLIVRSKDDGRFEILDGVTRYRELVGLGEKVVLCDVRNVDDKDALIIGLNMNMIRANPDYMGLAKAVKRLIASYGMKHYEIARQLNMSRSWVTKLNSLNQLPPRLQDMVSKNELSVLDACEWVRGLRRVKHERKALGQREKQATCSLCGSKKPSYEIEFVSACIGCMSRNRSWLEERKRRLARDMERAKEFRGQRRL